MKNCKCGEPATTRRITGRRCPRCARAFDRGVALGLDPVNWPWPVWAVWATVVGLTIGTLLVRSLQ